MVSNPRHTCTTGNVRIRMSATLLVARTRRLVNRRFSSSAPPINHQAAGAAGRSSPASASIDRQASYIQCGVSMPRKWPRECR